MWKYFNAALIWSIVLLVISLTTSCFGILADMPKAGNKSTQSKRRKKIIFLSCTILVGVITLLYLCWNNFREVNKASNIQTANQMDSIKRAKRSKLDSLKTDSLLEANKQLKIKIESLATNILLSQTQSFSKTAIKIQNSADSLNKYISGADGLVYLALYGSQYGDMEFVICRPNKFSARNVSILVLKYADFLSGFEQISGKRYFKVRTFGDKKIYGEHLEILPPGVKSTSCIFKSDSLDQKRFVARIEVQNNIYMEDIIVDNKGTKIAIKVFKVSGKHPGLYYENPHSSLTSWRSLFLEHTDDQISYH